MKYGLTLFCDERTAFKTDQIALIDRVLESFEDVSQLRSRSVCSQNTNTMLQTVRSSYSDINDWCQFFLRQDKPVYAYVLCGLSELKGGGSSYWNDRHLECLIVELQAYGFDVVLATIKPPTKKPQEQQWLKIYRDQCRELAIKHGCDTLPIRIGGHKMNHKGSETIAKRIAKDLKDRYADTVIGQVIHNVDKPVDGSQSKRRLRQMVEMKEEIKPKAKRARTATPLIDDSPQVKQSSKVAPKSNTAPIKQRKKATRKTKTSTVKIERL